MFCPLWRPQFTVAWGNSESVVLPWGSDRPGHFYRASTSDRWALDAQSEAKRGARPCWDFGFREAETKLIQGPYFSRQKKECHSKMWNMMINHEISAFPLSLDKAIWFHQGSRLFSILGCRATSAKKVPNVTKHRCRWRRSCRTGRCSGCSDRRSRPRIAPCIHQGTALIPVGDWEMAQNDMNDMGILSDINDHIPMMKASKKNNSDDFQGWERRADREYEMSLLRVSRTSTSTPKRNSIQKSWPLFPVIDDNHQHHPIIPSYPH